VGGGCEVQSNRVGLQHEIKQSKSEEHLSGDLGGHKGGKEKQLTSEGVYPAGKSPCSRGWKTNVGRSGRRENEKGINDTNRPSILGNLGKKKPRGNFQESDIMQFGEKGLGGKVIETQVRTTAGVEPKGGKVSYSRGSTKCATSPRSKWDTYEALADRGGKRYTSVGNGQEEIREREKGLLQQKKLARSLVGVSYQPGTDK